MKNLLILLILTATSTSCVSSKIYDELKEKNDALRAENRELSSQLDGASSTGEMGIESLRKNFNKCKSEKTKAEMELKATKESLERLQTSYDALASNSSENLTENMERNRKLLAELEAKERELNAKEQVLNAQEQTLAAQTQRLQQAQNELEKGERRVAELENIIAAKDATMKDLKNAISAALVNFEGNGLTVEQRDGKVYVSMENKLLFESGSWAVNARGREAVEQLGNVLGENKEIAVLIEGHTDNVPYGEKGLIKNNWDLSTKRATAIVNILTENETIPKENLTAAGRGEYAPITSNATSEGRAKNRRIEVVLTPKLDEISKLLEGVE
ncbi:cell envelope biogenesis protein OmpA [Patiriisocius marinistellae]|uniref:Cell envelope biogenesis protein OmpA n=1 Tax=Patiriisocius marinistellae TaxID=2494560 RepID=A0A5J4FYB7_9FLAO|nr:OmpA family protein [Patiriisocius marinistellae]GEQ84661.1 cell envelope biogenesis protein OmpA [Patiriisocius marinistellae]